MVVVGRDVGGGGVVRGAAYLGNSAPIHFESFPKKGNRRAARRGVLVYVLIPEGRGARLLSNGNVRGIAK